MNRKPPRSNRDVRVAPASSRVRDADASGPRVSRADDRRSAARDVIEVAGVDEQ
ncbi:hypothetical protein GSH05_03995 [Burkholderia pseudomallei]|uniref:Uncharacterized protein n=3 Tax=pseudomallei group TaxID=111527 RepID=A0AAX1X284_BURML|nr:hypothetical protein BMA2037 [Burkholderia mallei ATCC 23344]AUG20110.1 hypothetical protein CXQ84_05070 [Burkholderia pseudomallei]RKN97857.1 hypothetical protein D8O31_13720 [Burkholderia mallei]AYX07529.1 hypothetical protein EGY14_28420 [Burkholderia pseudomallei]AYX29206.1 hypothetical protein EGY16_14805 [Burkholderia pseudomallei]